MSERSEMEHVSRFSAGTIPLSVLIEFISQKVYTDLMRLIDLLPSKTDLEKKIEIATFFSRTQHIFIRLEALVKWSNSASKVDKCEKISNFLEEQTFFLISTANALSRLLRETLVSARLPPFSVLSAIEVFTKKGYTRLPKSIKNCAVVEQSINEKEKKEILLNLNSLIQTRLSLSQIPNQFRKIKIANGRAHFLVPNEFSVTLTLMSEALDFPWRILDIKFLIKDPLMNYQDLVHPAQTRLIINQAQLRLLHRQFDKRPPLVHLYDMLHAFSLSLQLDMLHEQAQRIRSKRSPDQFTIEAYRPSRCLSICYWHGLARTQYNSIMSLDGKLHPTAYSLTIHVDMTEPRRPLCLSHRPEISTSLTQLFGTTVHGNCLSIETLLTQTMFARAKQMLQDLRQELLVLSPGPIRLTDTPLCLYVPVLWPCGSQESLQVRVDPVQGFICASFPLLTSLDTEFGAMSSPVNVPSNFTGISENFSRSSAINALSSLESAFNQASSNRVRVVTASGGLVQPSSHESDRISSIQSRSLRNLAHGDVRWRSMISESLEHLRLCLGLTRLMQTAKIHRPFWHPFKRHLPLILSPDQVVQGKTPWFEMLIRMQQSCRWPILFAQLFPNNEYYIACEVILAPLNVEYKYYLIVCRALPEHYMSITTNSQGVLVYNHNDVSSTTVGQHPSETGLFLRVTHFTPLSPDIVWSNNPSITLQRLCACIQKAQSNIAGGRSSRLTDLLNRIKLSHAIDDTETISGSSSSSSGSVIDHQSTTTRLDEPQAIVPTLAHLFSRIGENLITSYLTMELSCAGIEHTGIHYDGSGCLPTIGITSIPFNPPSWYPTGIVPLMNYVHEIILRPYFDPFTHRRSWQLDILFTGIQPHLHLDSSINGANRRKSSKYYIRHQTAEWTISRLHHFIIVVHNILIEWESLCLMHALCYQVVNNPEIHLPDGVEVYSYNLKSLALVYGKTYLAEISMPTGNRFNLSLGFRPLYSASSPASSSDNDNGDGDNRNDNNDGDAGADDLGGRRGGRGSGAFDDEDDGDSDDDHITTNVDFNHHMIVRQHLEELLNTSKSIHVLATTLLNTLKFFQSMEYLRDLVLSYNGLKVLPFSSNCIKSVRGIVLIALSSNDLILIYRASLSLRIVLKKPQQPATLPTVKSSYPHNDSWMMGSKCIQLSDGYSQLTGKINLYPPVPTELWGDSQTSGNDLCNLVPLPAFAKFLKSLEELFEMNAEEISTGLTVSQFIQLIRPTYANLKSGVTTTTATTSPNRLNSKLTLLESYLSTSLLFHAAVLATQSLDVPVLLPVCANDQKKATVDDHHRINQHHREVNTNQVYATGAFMSVWSTCQLTVHVSMLSTCCRRRACQSTGGIECSTSSSSPSWWRLKIQLSQNQSGCDPRWPADSLSVFEEFFDNRVCSFPFQPSAVTAFFQLLLLPPHALRAMARVLAFDLHSPAQAPVYVRIGLIGMGINSRVTAVASNNNNNNNQSTNSAQQQNLLIFDTGTDLQAGMPGIIVRPPKITLQLLIMRSHSRHQAKGPVPLAQLVLVGYDWEANHVVIYPTSSQQQSAGGNSCTAGSSSSSSSNTGVGASAAGVGATTGATSSNNHHLRGQSDTGGSSPSLLRLLHDTDVESKANAMASSSSDSALVQLVLLITQTVAASYPISSAGPTAGGGGGPQALYG
ncbi:unnamed protein product [Trichobilharzia szidati]|nr:unnamed protein product [Trichobilharzia szidati]